MNSKLEGLCSRCGDNEIALMNFVPPQPNQDLCMICVFTPIEIKVDPIKNWGAFDMSRITNKDLL